MNKLWKIIKFVFGFLFLVFFADLVIILFFAFYTPEPKTSDTIIVLGAAINTPAAYNRSLTGLKSYQEGKAPVLVLSGGQDFKGAITEARYMQLIVESKSNMPVALILEDNSHSTYENLKNTKEKLEGRTGSLVIVSDKFHLARAVIMAKRLGFSPISWDSPDQHYYSFNDLLYYYGREVIAMISYIPKFIFG